MNKDILQTPITIIGMHRSGTTLLTKMLEVCGVYWGKNVDRYNEAKFFQNLNETIFRLSGSTWDNPTPIDSYFEDLEAVQKVDNALRKIVDSQLYQFYFESLSYASNSYGLPSRKWGWKDPRNTFTLPFWINIFPRMKVIHILRNGLDAADSLWRRETRRPPFGDPHYSHRCQKYSGCFSLWKDYVISAQRHLLSLNQSIEVRFEDLVAEPYETMQSLCDFAGFKLNRGIQERLVRMINPDRRYAFLRDISLKEYYHKVKNDELLLKLGYGF